MKAELLIKTFHSTENKEFIRALDYGLIKDEFLHHKKKLRYFGLPSEGLYDIQSWNEFIADFTAVEGGRSDSHSKQSMLVSRAIQMGYYGRLTLLRGDVNNVIIKGKDEVNKVITYPFELVNLDYGGSVLYPDRKRVEALEILFMKQKPVDFLLLITSNIREFDADELMKTQDRIRKEITQYRRDLDNDVVNYFKKINSLNSLLRQIIHVQFMIKCLAEQNKYQIKCFPAIVYEGSRKTKLIHYIFSLRYQRTASTRVISDQSVIDLLSHNTSKELKNGKLIDIAPVLEIRKNLD